MPARTASTAGTVPKKAVRAESARTKGSRLVLVFWKTEENHKGVQACWCGCSLIALVVCASIRATSQFRLIPFSVVSSATILRWWETHAIARRALSRRNKFSPQGSCSKSAADELRTRGKLLQANAERWLSGLKHRFAKIKSPVHYLAENLTKSLCQPRDSADFSFLDLLCFCSFCASSSDNLVTVADLGPSRT